MAAHYGCILVLLFHFNMALSAAIVMFACGFPHSHPHEDGLLLRNRGIALSGTGRKIIKSP